MTNKVDILILGAGIAGLGAALRARECNKNYMIFEARKSAGGLLDNFTVNGFRFDNAVHLSFATETKVRDIFDQTDYYTHAAEAWNFYDGHWLKHPAQNNLYPLPISQKTLIIKSFMNRPEFKTDNYESWLRHQYGDIFAETFPITYTKKYWDTDASELSTNWIGNRMRRAEADEILYGAFTSDSPNTYYVKKMRYPKKGGYRAFIDGLIDEAAIKYGYRAVSIDLANKVVRFSNGRSCRYNKLISSVPLPEMAAMTEDVSDTVRVAASSLEATSIDLISVGFNKIIPKYLWFYIYDEDIFASRVYSPSLKSPDNAPVGCSSLQFECYSRGKISKYQVSELKENVVYALKKMKVAQPEDIVFLHHKHLPYGNVIFDKGMEYNRDMVRNFLNENDVATIGRFGEWDYLWSNQSLLSGYSAIN